MTPSTAENDQRLRELEQRMSRVETQMEDHGRVLGEVREAAVIQGRMDERLKGLDKKVSDLGEALDARDAQATQERRAQKTAIISLIGVIVAATISLVGVIITKPDASPGFIHLFGWLSEVVPDHLSPAGVFTAFLVLRLGVFR